MTPLPKPPLGHSPIVDFCAKIIRYIKERRTIAGKGIRVTYTAEGEIIEADDSGGKKGTSGPPLWG
jgi:hypothetical protein